LAGKVIYNNMFFKMCSGFLRSVTYADPTMLMEKKDQWAREIFILV